jgi:hypothetical protein
MDVFQALRQFLTHVLLIFSVLCVCVYTLLYMYIYTDALTHITDVYMFFQNSWVHLLLV